MKTPARALTGAIGLLLCCCLPAGFTATAADNGAISHLFDITAADAMGLLLPTDVAVYGTRVYAVDSGNNRVVVFDQDGKLRFTLGREGGGELEFRDPVGIGAGPKGQIYVADSGNHRVQVLTAEGRFSRSIDIASNGVPIRPVDVAVDPETAQIFVTGNNNHKVMVYDRSGRLLREWGGNGTSPGKFRYPATIALTRGLDIGVVDVLNTRVQLFEQSGVFLTGVGSWGVLPGQLFRPKGIAVDRDGLIYVSDSYTNVIQVFDDAGKFIHALKSERELNTPSGIAVGGNERLFVAEMLEHRISVFRIE